MGIVGWCLVQQKKKKKQLEQPGGVEETETVWVEKSQVLRLNPRQIR